MDMTSVRWMALAIGAFLTSVPAAGQVLDASAVLTEALRHVSAGHIGIRIVEERGDTAFARKPEGPIAVDVSSSVSGADVALAASSLSLPVVDRGSALTCDPVDARNCVYRDAVGFLTVQSAAVRADSAVVEIAVSTYYFFKPPSDTVWAGRLNHALRRLTLVRRSDEWMVVEDRVVGVGE